MALLRGLVDLLALEADRNPDFANRLDIVLNSLPAKIGRSPKALGASQENAPDVYSKWEEIGETEFVLWLRALSKETLRAIIRANGFDPAGRTPKWKDVEKLSSFIEDSLRARLARGASFMTNERSD
uniref:Uncharacterized protein n=1 Tax=Bradyrhizobium amphicarpaeae TaxID=1404768 RepID=A0A2U8PNP8_9BRAD|nr:hypothetical protein CIT40_04740 [Bradyrhizobium amphicarpaeae]